MRHLKNIFEITIFISALLTIVFWMEILEALTQ